jgi:hypothetical protein
MTSIWDLFLKKLCKESPRLFVAYEGLLQAHGDKVEQYREYWESLQLNFNRCSVIYLLTYTNRLGTIPKHLSKEWVVMNYYLYVDCLRRCELEVKDGQVLG